MVRGGRIEFQGAIYHIIQRGNNRENVFESPSMKDFLINLLRKSVTMDGIELFAYVVMSNHYHLALRTGEVMLSQVMHRINTSYSLYYNRLMERTGHVFQGRYRSIIVHDENYLLSLIKYIHRNPVRAGICKDGQEFSWSSDSCYRKAEPGFIETEVLLDILSPDKKKSLKEYSLLMGQEDDYNFEEPATIEKNITDARDKIQNKPKERKPLDKILRETGINQTEYELIRQGSRLRKLTLFKTEYARNALAQGYSLSQIACYIGVTPAAALKYVNK